MLFSEIEIDLKNKGYKKSDLRLKILEVLKLKSVLDVPQILSLVTIKLKKVNPDVTIKSRYSNINKTSIYRQLEVLRNENIINEIDIGDGKKRYEIKPEKGHHHHLVCLKCNKIECYSIKKDLIEIENEINTQMKFKVQKHLLEFFGECENCQLQN